MPLYRNLPNDVNINDNDRLLGTDGITGQSVNFRIADLRGHLGGDIVDNIISIGFLTIANGGTSDVAGVAGQTDTYQIRFTDDMNVEQSQNFVVRNGTDGTDGTNGSDGAPGVGIQSITQDPGNNELTVTLTSGTTEGPFAVPQGVQGRFEFKIYMRAATQPATPTGGNISAGNTLLNVPTGWSTDIPTGTEHLWESIFDFDPANRGRTVVWSTPFQAGAQGPTGPIGPRGPQGPASTVPGPPGMDGNPVDNVTYVGGANPGETTTATFEVDGTAIGSVVIQPGTMGQTGPASTTPGPRGFQGVGIDNIDNSAPVVAGASRDITINLVDPSGGTTTPQTITLPAGAPGMDGSGSGLVSDMDISITRTGNTDSGEIVGGQIQLTLSEHIGQSHDSPAPILRGRGSTVVTRGTVHPWRTEMVHTGNELTFELEMGDDHGHFTYDITGAVPTASGGITFNEGTGNEFTFTGSNIADVAFTVTAEATHTVTRISSQVNVEVEVVISAAAPVHQTFMFGTLVLMSPPTDTIDLSGLTGNGELRDNFQFNVTGGNDTYVFMVFENADIDNNDFTEDTTMWELTNRNGFPVEFLRDATDSFTQGTTTVLWSLLTANERYTIRDIS